MSETKNPFLMSLASQAADRLVTKKEVDAAVACDPLTIFAIFYCIVAFVIIWKYCGLSEEEVINRLKQQKMADRIVLKRVVRRTLDKHRPDLLAYKNQIAQALLDVASQLNIGHITQAFKALS